MRRKHSPKPPEKEFSKREMRHEDRCFLVFSFCKDSGSCPCHPKVYLVKLPLVCGPFAPTNEFAVMCSLEPLKNRALCRHERPFWLHSLAVTQDEVKNFIYYTTTVNVKMKSLGLNAVERSNLTRVPRKLHPYFPSRTKTLEQIGIYKTVYDTKMVALVLREALDPSRALHEQLSRMHPTLLTPLHLQETLSFYARDLHVPSFKSLRFVNQESTDKPNGETPVSAATTFTDTPASVEPEPVPRRSWLRRIASARHAKCNPEPPPNARDKSTAFTKPEKAHNLNKPLPYPP